MIELFVLFVLLTLPWWVRRARWTAQRIAEQREDAGLPINPGILRVCLVLWPVFDWQDSELRRLW